MTSERRVVSLWSPGLALRFLPGGRWARIWDYWLVAWWSLEIRKSAQYGQILLWRFQNEFSEISSGFWLKKYTSHKKAKGGLIRRFSGILEFGVQMGFLGSQGLFAVSIRSWAVLNVNGSLWSPGLGSEYAMLVGLKTSVNDIWKESWLL